MSKQEASENEKVRKSMILDPWDGNEFSLEDLESMALPEENWLLEGYLARGSVSAIVGRPGEGKSMLARMLCCSIAQAKESFIGVPLHVREKRVLLISFEDSEVKTREYLLAQGNGLIVKDTPKNWKTNLISLIGAPADMQYIVEELHARLVSSPIDLLVVDSFGVLYPGDINNTTKLRQSISEFQGIARKADCSVLLIHHLRKAGYNSTPDQVHAQGAGGFGQGVRSLIDFRKDPLNADVRYFSLVKSNYASDDFLHNSRLLTYDPQTHLFLFRALIPKKDIPTIESHSFFYEIDWQDIFKDNREQSRAELLERLEREYGVKRVSADRYLTKLLKVRTGWYTLPLSFSLSHSHLPPK